MVDGKPEKVQGSACRQSDGNWQIAPHLMFFPAGMLGLTTLAFVVLGENLRDVLDPRGR